MAEVLLASVISLLHKWLAKWVIQTFKSHSLYYLYFKETTTYSENVKLNIMVVSTIFKLNNTK